MVRRNSEQLALRGKSFPQPVKTGVWYEKDRFLENGVAISTADGRREAGWMGTLKQRDIEGTSILW